LLKVKQVMKNHKQVEKSNVLWYGPHCFYKDNHHGGPSKWTHSSSRNESSTKNHKRPTHRCLVYSKHFLLQLKWNHPFKVIKQTLTTSKTCFFRELLSYLSLRSP
jgi:hypothetical protein